jgi:hypothetical protein
MFYSWMLLFASDHNCADSADISGGTSPTCWLDSSRSSTQAEDKGNSPFSFIPIIEEILNSLYFICSLFDDVFPVTSIT